MWFICKQRMLLVLLPNLREGIKYLYLSQLCEQMAVGQSGGGIDRSSPIHPTHSLSAGAARARPKPAPHGHARARPRPASGLMDLWRPVPPERALYPGYPEVGSLGRRRRRTGTTVNAANAAAAAAAQRMRTAGSCRPHSVIETSVAMETQATELHHLVRHRSNACLDGKMCECANGKNVIVG